MALSPSGHKFALLELSAYTIHPLLGVLTANRNLTAASPVEVLLSTLIETFHFQLSPNTEYEWKLGGIVSPGVKDDPVPKLPMLVSLARQAEL